MKEILENQDLLVNLVVVQELGVDREDPGLEVDREDPGLGVDRKDPGLEADQVQIQVEDVIIVNHPNGNRN